MTPFPAPEDSRVEESLLGRLSARWVHELENGAPVRFQVIEPAFAVVFAGAWVHADSPEVAAIAARATARAGMAARVDSALEVDVCEARISGLVAEVVAIDPTVLDRPGRLRYVLLCDKVSAWSQAQASRALAVYTGPSGAADADPAAEARRDRQLRLEVRVARKVSDEAAARDIDAARRLDAELRPVRDAWSRGQMTFRHVSVFLDRTRLCDADVTGAVLDRIGERLTSTPSTRIGTVVNAALAAIDPRGQATRARHARTHDVGVTQRSLPDGLGQITVIDKVEVTRAMIERIDDDADVILGHSQHCDRCAEDVPAEIGPARAAAFRGIMFPHVAGASRCVACAEPAHDTMPAPGPDDAAQRSDGAAPATAGAHRRSRRGELQVVIDLATLLGLADNPALLAGQAVPADLARELATECGSLRRIITDPVDGHLLDYGTRTYLPQALKDQIAARDGTCRAPGCNQPAARCQMDHVIPFPHGPSAVGNATMLCRRDHTIKTDGDLQILEHLTDGTTRWRTRDGQTGVTPPRSYLPERESPPPSPHVDPCPF
jgi:hypothetical protein